MTRTALFAMLLVLVPPRGASGSHDREFWRHIVSSNYAVPPGESVESLIRELNGFLASPDPELRDEFAYSITTAWVYQKRLVPADTLRVFADEYRKNLAFHIGDRNNDTVLFRSFSALNLSVLAALDNTTPFLGDAEYHRLVDAAVEYLHDERDLRGHDARIGWLHATAHTADLLKFLCRNPRLKNDEQREVLAALSGRLSSADRVFTNGETDRLARVVLSLYGRDDFDRAGFRSWLSSLAAPPIDAHVTDAALIERENLKNFLMGLFTATSLGSADLSARVADVQPEVLAAIRRLL